MKHTDRVRDYLEQICNAVDWIIDNTKDLKSFEMLQDDRKLQLVVERSFEIID